MLRFIKQIAIDNNQTLDRPNVMNFPHAFVEDDEPLVMNKAIPKQIKEEDIEM